MNTLARPSLARRWTSSIALVAALLGAAATAHAEQYWTLGDVLKSFFKTSTKVSAKAITLTDAEAAAIAKALGVKDVKRAWSIYIAQTKDKRDGYAVKDEEIGLHDPIDFAVSFNDKGAVQRVEIMVYREAYGGEVRAESFRKQFVGKTAGDAITAGKDIDIITGASYSSRSVALGVKRDTLVLQTALKNGL